MDGIKIDKCKNKDIFAIGLGGIVPDYMADSYKLVYAPLSDCGVILSSSQWTEAKRIIERGEKAGPVLFEIIEALKNEDLSKLGDSRINSISDFCNLSILPNNKCNFSCSFCYSANGRSKDELDFASARISIDSFIRRDSPARLSLSILGGGEPLLSWPLVKRCIDYAGQRARHFNKRLQVSITTNGSLITDEIIGYLKAHEIVTVVSYEILEDIQNLHRGHYSQVKERINRMFELDYTPQFNTVITQDNVGRLEEIVRVAHDDFPGLKYLCTDPVISPELFPCVEDLRCFHDAFVSNYFKARQLGKEYGLTVDCTANHSMDCTLTRYCPGEMGVTATGRITSCPCVSSEKEPRFGDYVYGCVSGDGLHIDNEALSAILRQDLYSHPECAGCPMKYNCGGGCMHKNNIFGEEFKPEMCRFALEFGRRYLFEEINAGCIAENEKNLIEMMRDEQA